LPKFQTLAKCVSQKNDTSELSEGNGEERKRVERGFGEKRLLGGWG